MIKQSLLALVLLLGTVPARADTSLWGIRFADGAIVSGGAGNAAGDLLTLDDGCSTHGVVAVSAVAGGAATAYGIYSRGSCPTVPTSPVGVLSTTGSGSGASFRLNYDLLPARKCNFPGC